MRAFRCFAGNQYSSAIEEYDSPNKICREIFSVTLGHCTTPYLFPLIAESLGGNGFDPRWEDNVYKWAGFSGIGEIMHKDLLLLLAKFEKQNRQG